MNPSRRVLFHKGQFWYAFGNTGAWNLLEESPVKHPSVLLLGCSDVRNVLETCAGVFGSSASTTKKSIPRSLRRRLSFTCNDLNPSIVARVAVLLNVCSKINATSRDDQRFLWSIWYDVALSNVHAERLQAAVHEVLEEDRRGGNGWTRLSSRGSGAVVRGVLRSWLAPLSELPSVSNVQHARRAHMLEHFRVKELYAPGLTWARLKNLEPGSACAFNFQNEKAKHVVDLEYKEYMETGTMGQPLCGGSHFVANPTVPHHQTKAWLVHCAADPFLGFHGKVKEANVLNSDSMLGACQQQLGQWSASIQRALQQGYGGGLSVFLHSGDALEHCLSQAAAKQFDLIDTSNLADHIGLMNILVCAGPCLKPQPSSKLVASTLVWSNDYNTVTEYIEKSVGMDIRLMPTILGLRLLADFEVGRGAQVRNPSALMHFRLDRHERVLAWQPVCHPVTQIQLDRGNLNNASTTEGMCTCNLSCIQE